MRIEENQKKQFIALCCLIVLVIGFALYRIIGVRTNAAPEQQDKAKVAAVVQLAEAEESESPQIEESNQYMFMRSLLMTGEARDPFIPQILPPSEGTVNSGQTAVQTAQAENTENFPFMPPFIEPTIEMQPMPGCSSAQPVSDPAKQFRLTGVIAGKSKIAIIRSANDTRHIVLEGQYINNKYKVESISSKGVWLSNKDKKFVLRLGGNS